MFQNSTIFEESQEVSRKHSPTHDYITFGDTTLPSPLKQFEFELEQNLHDLRASKNPKPHNSSYKESKSTHPTRPTEREPETNQQLDKFIIQHFKGENKLKCQVFLREALDHFVGESEYDEQEYAQVLPKIRKVFTTSNVDFVSLNALIILDREKPLRVLLMELVQEARYKIRHKDLDAKNTKILEALSDLERDIAVDKEALFKRARELKDKEQHLSSKEKELAAKERDFKSVIGKEYERLESKLNKLYSDKTQDLDKKSGNIERNLKYKIQILDKKLEELNNLRNGEKISVEKLKDRITRLDKENQSYKSKIRETEGLYQSSLLQQEETIKRTRVNEDKSVKLEERVVSLKDKLKAKEQEINSLQHTLAALKEQSKPDIKQQKEEPKQKQHSKRLKASKTQDTALTNLVRFSYTIFHAFQTSTLKMVNSYIPAAEKQLSLAQLLFPSAVPLIQAFYHASSQLFDEFPDVALSPESIALFQQILKLMLFCHKYQRMQECHNILDKVFDNNILKGSTRKTTSYFLVDDDLSSRITKHTKKLLKTCDFQQTLVMAIFSFLSSSSLINRSSSLVIINEIINDSLELKIKLLELDFVPLFLDKLDRTPQEVEAFMDILLEIATEEQVRERLFESLYVCEGYRDLWELLPLAVDKGSIVLQRLYYQYKDIPLESQQLSTLRKVKKEIDKSSMAFANLTSIQKNT